MIRAIVYGGGDQPVREFDDLAAAKAAVGTTWIHATNVEERAIERVADTFGLHPLAIEDVQNDVRAKTEEFADYTFVLVKTMRLAPGETTFAGEIETSPVGVFLGRDWVVTISPGSAKPVERVWDAAVSGDERLLQRGPDFTAYRVVDVIVDSYFDVLDGIEDQIESVEEAVVAASDPDIIEEINDVRRDLLSFRKQVWPAREAVGVLARGDPVQIQEHSEKYFRDVYDHLVQLVDLAETYRDLVTGARDIYLNALSQSTNEVMKVLTVVATIFIPLTFVAGVYGMNFDPQSGPLNMPELGWAFGYPAAMAGMALMAVVMVLHFRRRGYL